MKLRKRSLAVSLVLIGATAGCGRLEDERVAQRDVYNNYSDCSADWGADEGACEPFVDQQASTTNGTTSGGSRSSGGGVLRYYGPHYNYGARPSTWNTSTGARTVGNRATGSHTIGSPARSRGGFGRAAGSHGASS